MNRTSKKDFFKYLDRTINPEEHKSENKANESRQPSYYTGEKEREDNSTSASRKQNGGARR